MWEGIKDFLGDSTAGKWVIGGIAALAGLAIVGEASILGLLVAAALSALAIAFVPGLLGGGGDKPTLPDGKSTSGQASPRLEPLIEITSQPEQSAAAGKYDMRAMIDGQEYDIRMDSPKNAGGKLKVKTIQYKKVGEDDAAYKIHDFGTEVVVGVPDKDLNPVFNEDDMGKMLTGLSNKKIRATSKAARRDEGLSDLNKLSETNTYSIRSKESAYIVKYNDGHITVNDVNGRQVGETTIKPEVLAEDKQGGIFVRAVIDTVVEAEKNMKPGELVKVGKTTTALAPIANVVDKMDADTDEKAPGTSTGTFKLKGQDTEYHYEIQSEPGRNASNNQFFAKAVTIKVGDEVVYSGPVKGNLQTGSVSDVIDPATNKFSYTPDNDVIGKVLVQAMDKHDEKLKDLSKLLSPVETGDPDKERHLLKVPSGDAYDITTTNSGGKFNVTVNNMANEADIEVKGTNFDSAEDAVKAALHAISHNGEKAGSPDKDLLQLARTNVPNYTPGDTGKLPSPVTPAASVPAGRDLSGIGNIG